MLMPTMMNGEGERMFEVQGISPSQIEDKNATGRVPIDEPDIPIGGSVPAENILRATCNNCDHMSVQHVRGVGKCNAPGCNSCEGFEPKP